MRFCQFCNEIILHIKNKQKTHTKSIYCWNIHKRHFAEEIA